MLTVKTIIHVWYSLSSPQQYVAAASQADVNHVDHMQELFHQELGGEVGHRVILELDVQIPPIPVFRAAVPAT